MSAQRVADADRISVAADQKPLIPRVIHTLALPIFLGWIALAVVLSVAVPSLEVVGQEQSVSLSPSSAPSMQAMTHIGRVFQESNSDASAMVVLEADHRLGDAEHRYYADVIAKFRADPAHITHVEDFWGDPLTAASAQSEDGKATYVQLNLAGNQGEPLANDSIAAVRHLIDSTPKPPGLHVYVTGTTALIADQHDAGDKSLKIVTALTMVVILVSLFIVYRSVATVFVVLFLVGLEVAAGRGVVAALGHYQLIGLSTFSVNLLTMLAIAAGTDYAIFVLGRYHEARHHGEDKETAFYTMYRGTAHVILGSGLTIAGATFCLRFTRLPYFQTLGIPLAIGILVAVLAALTMAPAVLVLLTRFGILESKRAHRTRGWRRVGTAVVRWPGPILAASCALALVGLLALPGYKTSYNDRKFLPDNVSAMQGFAAADRHFSQARMNPELLMLESTHDLRNSTDMLIIERIARNVFHTPGIARVQTISRPLGTPLDHSTIPYQMGMQAVGLQMTRDYMQRQMDTMTVMAKQMDTMITTMDAMMVIMDEMSGVTSAMTSDMKAMVAQMNSLFYNIADFDDFMRPMRNYLYWEPHCYDIPVCWSLRSVFDAMDGVDTMSDLIAQIVPQMDKLNAIMPKMKKLMLPMVAMMRTMKNMMLSMHSTMAGMQDQQAAAQSSGNQMGAAFDGSKNDDSFYLPPEVFDNADFKRGMNMFFSPDGKAVRFIISHQGDPASDEGISHVNAIRNAAFEAIKGTPLENSKIYIAGTAAIAKDMKEGSTYDLLIAGVSALILIFVIMLIITRAIIASAIIVGTVLLSLGTSFGLSVLIWQYILGMQLHWMILAMSVIILLAVGSDYNLLLVSRFKEEIHAGIKTGIIRSMAGTGAVVTSAGLVFAFTMLSFGLSALVILGQVGSTIGMGLLFDTLIVRSFMTPSIAALLGRWFWWPQRVRNRPLPAPVKSHELTRV
ncbi:RND family transporter [Mycobacterium sp. OTB74]|uniref:MMPL/RND family transporter n=1 Tax=Mycobacterium sp. OTB74 TaxID=1853452 RepID=UPI0024734F3B|nr:RND family transporter [Mycobacterium sp. OTB74]MDH6243191.1 RND superfamily putative drug exporter [Mycobacterium sp. OTB74]